MADDRDPDRPAPSSDAADREAGSGPGSGDVSDSEAAPDRRAGGSEDDSDQTREFDPFADDNEDEADATAADADQTARLPAAGDETRPMPAADETRPMPAADKTAQAPTQPAAWSGRAGVPPPEAGIVLGPAPTEWAPPGDDRKWWMPIVLGLVALLLLGALITGIWLIYDANKVGPTPTPSASPTLATSSAPATSAAPTTSAAPPPTTAPAGVAVPPLVGLTDEQARDALDQLGLSYRLVYRPADAPPNTVIETDPPEGESVPEGTEITLVIASPLTPTDPSTSAPDGEPTPTS